MGAVIAPCILAENSDQYQAAVARLTPFAERVHIDFCDGEFAPTFTVGLEAMSWPENWQVDIHAMVARPSEYVQQLASKKPSLIVFHAEISEDLLPVIRYLKQLGIKSGVALQRSTVPLSVRTVIEEVDHVQIFSGNLGQHGGVASLMQLEKLRLIRAIRPSVEIGWDGGVTVENAFTLAQGGVEVLNVGGTIAKSDEPQGVYGRLVSEINKRGVI